MIPMKLTSENVKGTEISCGRSAAEGVFARDAKSGAFLETTQNCTPHEKPETLRDERGHVADGGHET
jgi:hypothetical protein